MQRKRKILALDGGGIKGVLAAAFLATIEEAAGKRIADYFDLVAGTSTGGIIALGLGLGMSAREIESFYVSYGPNIFDQKIPSENLSLFDKLAFKLRALGHRGRQVIWPKYDPAQLSIALRQTFQERTLGDSTLRLIIPAYNADKDDIYVFKTSHHERLQLDWKEQAVDVALATAAAPTYFRGHLMPSGAPLIDGGIWANNPAGMAAVEAHSILGWKNDDLFVLSLGCTEEVIDIPVEAGYKDLFFTAADLFMRGQSRAAEGTAKLLSGHSETASRYFRYQPKVPTNKFSLDKVEMIDRLRGLGATCAREALPMLRQNFLDQPAEPFISA